MTYTVVKGDNLTRIAKKFDTTVSAVAELNNLPNPNKIYVGQVLKIPDAPIKEEPVKPANSLLDEFLAYLEKQVGHIYVWGAQGQNVSEMPNPEEWIRDEETSEKNANRAIAFYRKQKAVGKNPILAYDCSGLIMHFMIAKGVFGSDLSSRGLYAKCEAVTRETLHPGDLLFRHNGKKIHHVGVYVGNGEAIEAEGRDSGVVKHGIDANGKGYWNRYGRLKKKVFYE